MFNDSFSIIQFIIGILASISTLAMVIPQSIKTFYTKDTSGLSKWFFINSLISSCFWLSLGIMTIISPFIFKDSDLSNALASGIPPIITNFFGSIFIFITLWIKLKNIHNAKKLNISEVEYCNKVRRKGNKIIEKI